ANGNLDSTFGSGGRLTTGGPNFDDAFGVAVQTDRRILVVGAFDIGVNPSIMLVRLLGQTISVADTSVNVRTTAATSASFVVSLSVPGLAPVSVNFTTVDGTAKAGTEYTATSGTLTFAPAQTSRSVSVPVLASGRLKPDQSFRLQLSSPVGASILRGTATATLNNPKLRSYWMVASDGGIFSFGDAGFFGSTGDQVLNRPVVGMAATPSGQGYWMVASDGGIFSFGDAGFFGSTGDLVLNRPIVGMASTGTGVGYWMVASDGGIFAFGDAEFRGSTGDLVLNLPVVAMAGAA
ncbi:MAG: Calx-beta domain-containing protein, partial [Acidimicrobiales bacterium]